MPNYHLSSVKIFFFCDFDLLACKPRLKGEIKGRNYMFKIFVDDDVFPSHILIFPDNIFKYAYKNRRKNQALIKNYSLIH